LSSAHNRNVNRAHRQSTRLFAVAICGLGLAMIVTTVARGGGALALGVVVGAAFVALGAGRLYLAGDR
jgi:hypothetical protein